MKIELLTIFPEMFDSFLHTSIIGRACENHLLDIHATDIRPFSASKHKNTDDYPFGGGAGMLMMPQPIADAMKSVTAPPFHGKRIFMGPKGRRLDQKLAQELANEEEMVILCGHYEGVDQRVLDHYIDMEISIGDYILTGGETAAMVLIDCVSRLIPGVLGSEESAEDESFSNAGLLEYPQYTRPRVFEGEEVPTVLLNGDHKKIAQWRREQALLATARLRPDLLEAASVSEKEMVWLKKEMIKCAQKIEIETPRLIITRFSKDMAHDVHINSLDEDVRRFVPDEVFETEEDAAETIEYLMSCYDGTKGPYVYPMLIRDSQQNIGYVQLSQIEEGWEIGYHVAKPYTGNGYATEAVESFVPIMMQRLRLQKVYGICLTDNTASRRVMEKCGFQLISQGIGTYQGAAKYICRYVFLKNGTDDMNQVTDKL